MKKTVAILLFLSFNAVAQQAAFRIDSLPKQGINLDKGWKWHAGDNPDFAKAEFDDGKWESIDPTKDIYYLPQTEKESVGWLRIHLSIDSLLLNRPLAFLLKQTAASELFLNGKLLQSYGTVSTQPEKVKAFDPVDGPSGLLFDQTNQVLAVRFSVQKGLIHYNFAPPFPFFRLRVVETKATERFDQRRILLQYMNLIYGGLFFLLGFIHLGFFISFPKQKANLFFSLFALAASAANLLYFYVLQCTDVAFKSYAGIIDYVLLFNCFGLFLILAIYYLFHTPKRFVFWFIVLYSSFGFVIHVYSFEYGFLFGDIVPLYLAIIESLRVALKAYIQGKRGVGLLVFGTGSYFVLYLMFLLGIFGILPPVSLGHGFTLVDLLYNTSMICMSLSFSIYLAREFAFTSKDLEKKLEEVQQLSAEKQQILSTQNETLEKQVEQRTAELKASQNQLIQKEKLASLGELTAGIAHEIQNPLNFVNNFSEVSCELVDEMQVELNKGDTDEAKAIASDLKQNLLKINHHGKRASSIVSGMLEHSRTSTGERQPTDINKLTDEYLRLSYHGMRAKNSSFNADYELIEDSTLPLVNVVPQDIGRVLLNLINNAFYAVLQRNTVETGHALSLHATPKYQPTVIVSTQHMSNQIVIAVKDNGNGIPANILPKIFQPFFTTKPTGEGTGLGLSLSYDIITKGHGGTIEAESVESEGTTFIVKLPIA